MRRFWRQCDVAEDGEGFAITLDGRGVRTPARASLVVPTRQLAEAIQAEWNAQTDLVDPRTMPMTGIANAAIDHATRDPASFAATIAAYGETDLLCYRDDRDPALAAAQAAGWNPLLAWVEAEYGIEFTLASGVMHVAQPPATMERLAAAVHAMPPFRLAALSPLVTIGGSLVAALAIETGARNGAELWPLLCMDELHQEERWGADDQARAARAARERDWNDAARFLTLL